MRLEQLAKDSGSGSIGCPSVHLDHDGSGDHLVVQGDGIVVTPAGSYGEAVIISAVIVAEALAGLGVDVYGAPEDYLTQQMVVTGPFVDIRELPNPLPGEGAVRTDRTNLRMGLCQLTMRRKAEIAEMVGRR